ncbi:hypothetical protein ACHAPO_011449 [Fusarium lateritium]
MLLTNAARLQKTERGSVNITQFVAARDAAKEYQTKTNPSVSPRETLRCGFAQSIVARQMTATNIAATQTPSTVKITPRRTNARLRTALRIEVQNTTATNTLVSILTALGRRWPRAGAKENAVTISRVRRRDVPGMWTWIPITIRRSFAPTIVNARWHDAMVSSRRDRRFVPSMSALFQAAIDPETLIVPLALGSVTDTGVLSSNVGVLMSTPRVSTSRGALDTLANYQDVIKKPGLMVGDPLSVLITAASTTTV